MRIAVLVITFLISSGLHAEHPAFYNGKFGGSVSKSEAFWLLGSKQKPKGRSDLEIRIRENKTAQVVLERDMIYPATFELERRGQASNLLKFKIRTSEGELTRFVIFDTNRRSMIPLHTDGNRMADLDERDRLPVLEIKLEPLPADAPQHIRDLRNSLHERLKRME